MKALKLALAAALTIGATAANATIAIVFDDFDDGFANFASTVTGAGGTQTNTVLAPGPVSSPDFTITRPNGGIVNIGGAYSLFNANPGRSTTGGVININPSGPSRGIGAKESGITFNFTNGINALGFEVGDWSTCCQPSDLYIQFGNNTPIRVGASVVAGDQYLTNGGAGVFVAAFDDTDTFTEVSFWGDGFGEFLVVGGTIRFGAVDLGGLPPSNPVPEPATWAMLIVGFGLVGATARRRRTIAA